MSQSSATDHDYRRSCRKYLTDLLSRHDHKGAARYFESIQSLWKDSSDLDGGILMRLGARALGSSGDCGKALPLIRTAINIISRLGNESTELGECFVTLGEILRDMGKYAESEKAYRDAESIFRRNDDISRAGDALNLLAGLLFRKGDLDGSLRYLLEAVESARKGNEKKKLAYMFGNIGRVYTMLGKLEAAAENIRVNIELSGEFGDELEMARAWLSLGYVYIQQRKFNNAEEALASALELIRRGHMEKEEAIYLTYAGELAIRAERYNDAEQLLNDAAATGKKLSPDSLLAARPIRHLADLAARRGNYRKALSLANQGLQMMKNLEEKIEIGALQRIMGCCLEKLEQPEKAREAYCRSLEILEESKAKFELADGLVEMGRSSLFDSSRRTMYLCRAEDIYAACGVQVNVTAIQRQISDLDITARGPKAESLAAASNDDFPTGNAAMARIISQLKLLKGTDLPILLTGETGTGKDFLAKYFHSISRPNGPYVAINCAAVPETLLESELFGYQKGAFTGAEANKPGLFLAANKGVLLLDEIGELPLMLQAKLLSILETKKLRPLGTATEYELDIIIIAATNRDLYEMVKAGQFRLDLYYRLAGITVELPPLRERKEDIPYLLELFMRRSGLLSGKEKPHTDLTRQFVGYNWPGNIRQLENKVKQLAVMAAMAREGSLAELSRSFFDEKRDEETNSLFDQVERFEKRLLVEALITAGGNKSEAARLLSIHESTLRAKLKRYNLECMIN